eukprot:Hpha_TRINITY_DN15575_c2_g8::TRINITY_DN15575_c2_g8_i2::g.105676::m.105676
MGVYAAGVLLLSCAVGTAAKGSAAGVRTKAAVVGQSSFPRAYGIFPIAGFGAGYHYRSNDGKEYAPAYGAGWQNTPGWDGGKQSCGACGCPKPRPLLTKNWVWVQMQVSAPLSLSTRRGTNGTNDTNGSSSGNGGDLIPGEVDVVTFEVDAFKHIASAILPAPHRGAGAADLRCVEGGFSFGGGGAAGRPAEG